MNRVFKYSLPATLSLMFTLTALAVSGLMTSTAFGAVRWEAFQAEAGGFQVNAVGKVKPVFDSRTERTYKHKRPAACPPATFRTVTNTVESSTECSLYWSRPLVKDGVGMTALKFYGKGYTRGLVSYASNPMGSSTFTLRIRAKANKCARTSAASPGVAKLTVAYDGPLAGDYKAVTIAIDTPSYDEYDTGIFGTGDASSGSQGRYVSMKFEGAGAPGCRPRVLVDGGGWDNWVY